MGRIRTLKPEFFRSRSLSRVYIAARLTFQGLWCEADDFGHGVADPRIVKGAVWPLDDEITHQDVAGHLAELEATGHIQFYEVAGDRYFLISSWEEHQAAAYRRGKAQFPEPSMADTPTPVTVPDTLHDEECKEVQLASPVVQKSAGTGNWELGTRKGTGIAPAQRARDPLWDSIIDCWCLDPSELTDTERARLNKATKLLRDVQADPAEIPRRRARYRSRYPDAADTPMAVAGRWSELRQNENGSTPKMPAGTEHTQRNLERMLADGTP